MHNNVLAPPKPLTEMVAVPAAGSTAFTNPPSPRFCQSWRSSSLRASTSDRFITTIDAAVTDLASSEALPATRIRSPACSSCNSTGVAFFRVFSPGAMRTMRAPA